MLGLDPEHLEVLEDGEHDVAHGAGPRRYGEQADEVPAEAAGGLRAPGHQDALAAEDVHANLERENKMEYWEVSDFAVLRNILPRAYWLIFRQERVVLVMRYLIVLLSWCKCKSELFPCWGN